MRNPLLASSALAILLLCAGCKKSSDGLSNEKIPTATGRHLAAAVTGTTYYVDPAGNDSNNGTSPTTPWQTISKVNAQTFLPGDQLLFKAGGTWAGNITFLGSGSAGAPIIVDMYGTGNKPVINGGGLVNGSITLLLSNQSYWEINNLEITNNITTGLHYAVTGIKVNNSNSTVVSHVYVRNCYVHDVNSTGVGNSNYNKGTGGIIISGYFNDILVDSCHVANSQIEGIRTTSSTLLSTNVTFSNNLIENIYGDGIVMSSVQSGCLITGNVVHNACITNAANFAGIWTYNESGTKIANNEVYGLTGGLNDGEAFDADISTNGDIFEYNYSHDNYGGFMLFMPSAKNIIVRYNISANDAKGGTKMFNFTATDTTNQIYNNVFYLTNNITYFFQTKFIGAFTNNIISSTGTVTNFSQNIMSTNARFLNNCIYPNAVILASNWNGCYHSNNIFFSPQFTNPTAYGVGRSTAIGFSLQSTSPCVAGGLIIANNGGYDFFNTALSASGNPDAGAIKY
ncbi:right-handed parallel beta-helix repeat-containing protein [Mucilaginibacter sp. X5P1]|uniref:right-handed parallel beta-helix repeat-containing protein n=1 Tax=Mucilaginibacter sp. X5P1 TaxID=2723088 RepID=UPI00161588D3|nr:right-handed parallel beta-helix repeat-containing protein [Mucilaginibacter sp. X5P1]